MFRKSPDIVGSLLTIGDELLLGDILNGNSRYIALELRKRGFRLDKMLTIGDCEEGIVKSLCQSLKGSNFLIVTGGLGPTDDDRTCAAVARAFNLPLVSNFEYQRYLQVRMKDRGIRWSEHISRMAELPEGAVKIGMEMAGFFMNQKDIPCYFLPGVPDEMKTLLNEVVIPDLEERFPNRSFYIKHVLRIQGLMESEINELLKDLTFERIGAEIGYLPQVGENWITMFVSAENEEEAWKRIQGVEEEIVSRIGLKNVSGHNDECLEKTTGSQLRQKGWKLAIAESCTGGLLCRKISAVPGASDYLDRGFVTYSNKAKVELLNVPEDLINKHGAVSEAVALAMVRGAIECACVDVAVSITGIAGPSGGTPEKPVGTVFIACASPLHTVVKKYEFGGSRDQIQESAAQAALALLWRTLSHDTHIHCH